VSILEAFAGLLTDTMTLDPPGRIVCQLVCDDGRWWTVPLEWNTCCALVDRGLAGARIVTPDGDVARTYPEAKEHA
jgi:hypothetical protein